jgi:hypothetical protein
MSFKSVALLAVWTLLIGPIVAGPSHSAPKLPAKTAVKPINK